MIEPEAEIAAAITDSGRVGVLATPATVAGGAYLRALGTQHRELTVTEVAAPDLAAIIQRGFPFSEEVVETVRSYCAPLKRARVDTVILGCTHYPLVRPDAPAVPRPRRAPGDRRPRARGHRPADPRVAPARDRQRRGGRPTGSCAPATRTPSASSAPAFCSCRSARSSGSTSEAPLPLSGWPILEQVQADTRTAMKAGERDRVTALRLVADALQKDAQGRRRRRGRGAAPRAQAPARGRRGLPRRRQRRPRRGRGGRGARDRALPASRDVRRRPRARSSTRRSPSPAPRRPPTWAR